MKIQDAVVLVTGANRGLGKAFAQELVAQGAKKVYAAARDPKSVNIPGVTAIQLDVTAPDQVAAAARNYTDVNVLINNAGIGRGTSFLDADAETALRAELETNLFGPMATARAFAPVLAANGGGAILNVLSALSWVTMPGAATYSATKSAAWSLTNSLRQVLAGQNTQVVAVHVGFMDTDMAAGVDAPKADPRDVARQSLAALETGAVEVLADATSRHIKQGLSAHPGVYLPAGAQ